MRGMNLPQLPNPPSTFEECLGLYVSRLEHGRMAFPEASQLLTAYMGWPNDETERDRWMATAVTIFAAEQDASDSRVKTPTEAKLELFGGLRAVAYGSLSYLMDKLGAVQNRWPRVADVLQLIIDISQETRGPIRGGASISKAYDVLRGHRALPRKSQLSKDWRDFRDVAHLIAAAAAIASACRGKPAQQGGSAVLTPVLLVPEVVLALGLAYQEFGLSFKPHGQREPVLPPETLWRVPRAVPVFPLPVRRLSDEDFKYLTTKRRATPKMRTTPKT